MMQFISDALDWSKLADGVLLAAGMAAVYFSAIAAASMIRSFGMAGGAGILYAGRVFVGWRKFQVGDQSDIVNVTLNTTIGGKLSIDTLVADKALAEVWRNPYHVRLLRAAAQRCSAIDPIIRFPRRPANGNKRRDDYRSTYDPLVSLIAERCTNEYSLDLALGKGVVEHRFVVALTFEKNCDVRSQHFRAMMIREDELLVFPSGPIKVERPELNSRVSTLRNIAAAYYRGDHSIFGIVKIWRPQ